MSRTLPKATPDAFTRTARCPRCGYDQRGVIETWRESCPLDGVCSECGLQFEWPELLSNHVRWPRWCVEFSTGVVTFPMRAATTLARTVWPWGFWRSLRMHHEPRWPRIAAYLVYLIAFSYVLFSVGQGLIAVRVWNALQTPSKMRTPPMAVVVHAPFGTIVSQALLTPFSSVSPGFASYGGMKHEYPPPSSYLPDLNGSTFICNTGTWGRSYDFWYFNPNRSVPPSAYTPGRTWFARGLGGALTFIGHSFLTLLFSMLAFAVLPQTRRLYKIRWAHIVRIAAYASALLILPVMAFVLHGQISRLRLHGGSFNLQWIFLCCFIYWPIWLTAWWAVACRRYLRLPHAWGIGASIVIVGVLCSLACGYLSLIARFMV